MESTVSKKRLGIVVTVALAALVAFGAAGGTGLAAKPSRTSTASPNAATPLAATGKATICHKQKVTIRISESAVAAHLAHGDVAGQCAPAAGATAATTERAAAKAARVAAKAKAKAAKAAAKAGKKSKGDDEEDDD